MKHRIFSHASPSPHSRVRRSRRRRRAAAATAGSSSSAASCSPRARRPSSSRSKAATTPRSGAARPEPEPDVHGRRQDRVPDLAHGRPARRHGRRPQAGRLGQRQRPREGAARRSPIVEGNAAGIVGDHGTTPGNAPLPLFLYVGTVAGAQSGGHIALHVTGGNWRALRSLLGQSLDQTFTYGDGTIFLLWQGKVPTVIDAVAAEGRRPHHGSRPRAAPSTLAQVEAIAGRARRRPRAGRPDDAERLSAS